MNDSDKLNELEWNADLNTLAWNSNAHIDITKDTLSNMLMEKVEDYVNAQDEVEAAECYTMYVKEYKYIYIELEAAKAFGVALEAYRHDANILSGARIGWKRNKRS